ncbi:MAG: DUF4190 domain-containing protein [Pseudomonadales bacterium]|nr:DUF4190 domain-containing protein [Pseudomonadales bacterium]
MKKTTAKKTAPAAKKTTTRTTSKKTAVKKTAPKKTTVKKTTPIKKAPVKASNIPFCRVHPARTIAFSVVALVLGIISFVFILIMPVAVIFGVLAIIFGLLGLQRNGRGMALSGLVLGAIGSIGSLALIAWIVMSLGGATQTPAGQLNSVENDVVISLNQDGTQTVGSETLGFLDIPGDFTTENVVPGEIEIYISPNADILISMMAHRVIDVGADFVEDFKEFMGANDVSDGLTITRVEIDGETAEMIVATSHDGSSAIYGYIVHGEEVFRDISIQYLTSAENSTLARQILNTYRLSR